MVYGTSFPNPHRRSLLGGSFASLLLLFASGARAEAAPLAVTWSQEAFETEADRVESPELRTLRLAEEQLFGVEQASREERPAGGDAMTEPPATFERNGEQVDLSFLKGLELPATPVRWDNRVIEYLLFFKDDPRGRELAAAWIKRRERFGPMVRRILAEESLPADLQYVAMIESGYDPRAHSASEAWGMWQFIQQPAEYYGLRVDHWADERLDPERSTRAAARFMRDLYERFGNWELSFAAYNMGYGGLLRAIKKYNSNDYWLLSHLEAGLPFETSLYVAKISAMAIVAHNPERFGFAKLAPEPTLQLAKIDVAAGSTLENVAAAAGLPLDKLKAVNPHLKQSRVPPGEPAVQVYLPRENLVRFTQNWSNEHEALPLPYVVRLGETLEQVAKRTATTVQALRELNELDDNAQVKAGFSLLVPNRARVGALDEQLVCSVPARTFEYADRRQVFYKVGPEDSTQSVARFFDVQQEELVDWNSLAPGAALQPGMLLQMFVSPERDLSQAVVYTPDEVRVLTVGSNEFFDYHESQRGRVRVRYRVQKSDTLAGLAQRFDLSVGSLGRINQFPTNRELRAGERIVVYAHLEQLAQLEKDGLAERFRDEDAQLARTSDELPESEGKRALDPKPEAPIPSAKKVEAPSKSAAATIAELASSAPKPATKKAAAPKDNATPSATPKNAKSGKPAAKPGATTGK